MKNEEVIPLLDKYCDKNPDGWDLYGKNIGIDIYKKNQWSKFPKIEILPYDNTIIHRRGNELSTFLIFNDQDSDRQYNKNIYIDDIAKIRFYREDIVELETIGKFTPASKPDWIKTGAMRVTKRYKLVEDD